MSNTPIAPIFHTAQIVPKGWGHEQIICNTPEYCGKVLHFHKGARFSYHFHVAKHETFWLQKGHLQLTTINPENAVQTTQQLTEGSIVEIPRLLVHQITALEESDLIEFSTHHEDGDSHRVLPGDSQK